MQLAALMLVCCQSPSPSPELRPYINAHAAIIFRRFDSNRDGYLSRAELARACRGPSARPSPPLYDRKGYTTPRVCTDTIIMSLADQDLDGRISLAEYEDFCDAQVRRYLQASR